MPTVHLSGCNHDQNGVHCHHNNERHQGAAAGLNSSSILPDSLSLATITTGTTTSLIFFPRNASAVSFILVKTIALISSGMNLGLPILDLDFRRQNCFTDNSHDIITLHTIGKVCQSKEIVGNLEDFALGTVFKLSSACFRISPSTDYAFKSPWMTSIAILYLETTTMLQSRIVKRAKRCNPAARTLPRSETSVLR